LTTGICCDSDETEFLKVVAGRKDLSDTSQGQEAFLESKIEHDDYDSFDIKNNICLMKLSNGLR